MRGSLFSAASSRPAASVICNHLASLNKSAATERRSYRVAARSKLYQETMAARSSVTEPGLLGIIPMRREHWSPQCVPCNLGSRLGMSDAHNQQQQT